ncbi:MAG: hypothetical protein ACLP01_30520 [Solirubrobacteraceae bacterium]
MNSGIDASAAVGKRRRWLLAIDPVFEGGRRGKRAQAWDVEDELIAVAILGDVTIDLSRTRSVPAEVDIEAYALLRDVDVLVPEDTHVELFGGVLRGDLENHVPPIIEDQRTSVVRIHGHCLFGDVTPGCQDILQQLGRVRSESPACAVALDRGSRSEPRSCSQPLVDLGSAGREQLLHYVLRLWRQVLVAEHTRGDRQDSVRRGRTAQPREEPDVVDVSVHPRSLHLEGEEVFR